MYLFLRSISQVIFIWFVLKTEFTNKFSSFVHSSFMLWEVKQQLAVKEDVCDKTFHIWQNLLLFNMLLLTFKDLVEQINDTNSSTQGDFHHLQDRWQGTILQRAEWGGGTGSRTCFFWVKTERARSQPGLVSLNPIFRSSTPSHICMHSHSHTCFLFCTKTSELHKIARLKGHGWHKTEPGIYAIVVF